MKVLEAVQQAVPSGKALVWIVGTAATTFAAGLGVAFGFGETADNIEAIPAMKAQVEENTDAIVNLQDGQDRLLCVSTLTATGEVLTPLEVQQRCP